MILIDWMRFVIARMCPQPGELCRCTDIMTDAIPE